MVLVLFRRIGASHTIIVEELISSNLSLFENIKKLEKYNLVVKEIEICERAVDHLI